MRVARIWYSRDPNQEILPGGFENEIVLSDEFFREITTTPFRQISKQPKRSLPCQRPSIYSCGCLTGVSQPKDKRGYRSSAISAWRASWGVPIMQEYASFESD
jgi:hypothetical protein